MYCSPSNFDAWSRRMKTRNLHVYTSCVASASNLLRNRARSHYSRAHISFYVACMHGDGHERFHFCTPCGESFLWKSQLQRHTASSKHKTVAGRLQLLDELEDDGIDTPPMAIVEETTESDCACITAGFQEVSNFDYFCCIRISNSLQPHLTLVAILQLQAYTQYYNY